MTTKLSNVSIGQFKKLGLLGLSLTATILMACSTDANDNKASGSEDVEREAVENLTEVGEFPIVNEEIELSFFAGQPPSHANDYEEVTVWETYEDMTNIDVEWELVPTSGLEERRNIILSSDDLPDVFYRSGMPIQDIYTYGEQGVFLELNDLIEENMPNLTAIFKEYPEVLSGITFPDGKIYALPTIYASDSVVIGSKPWIRQDWLDELNLDMPETTEDYYNYLVAVRDSDITGDEAIPFGSWTMGGLVGYMKGAWGLGNRGTKHQFIDEDPENPGNLRFFPTDDKYREMLEYLNTLFEEGLIQENIYTIEQLQHIAQGQEGLFGSVILTSPITLYGEEVGNLYSPLPALEGPHGDRYYTDIGNELAHMNGFVLTKENENPEATLRWMDYFYGMEGATFYFMGVEGETYEVKDDGSFEYVEEISDTSDGSSLEQNLVPHVTWMGGGYPGIVREEYFSGAETLPESMEAAELLDPHLPDETWPSFTFTAEENDEFSALSADIQTYVNEARDLFITGEMKLSDEEWENYVSTIEQMGLERYMEIYTQAYERFEENR